MPKIGNESENALFIIILSKIGCYNNIIIKVQSEIPVMRYW